MYQVGTCTADVLEVARKEKKVCDFYVSDATKQAGADNAMRVMSSAEDMSASVLTRVLQSDCVYPVYQPIVSLQDGEIYAYEALSRINLENFDIGIEDVFKMAEKNGRSWEIDTICRKKALEQFAKQASDKRLFLNVDPNIIYDDDFKNGFTKNSLDKLGISKDKIAFEITERVAILDKALFFKTIEHYKAQNFAIAIDDVGSGFSGLNVIVDVKPSFIKLDMHLVRNIDEDETKRVMCRALADFCKSANIKIIAEGIEREEELEELISLGVDYGQGFFLSYPGEKLKEIEAQKKEFILKQSKKNYIKKTKTSIYPVIKDYCRKGCTFTMDTKAEDIYFMLSENPAITEFTVLDNEKAVGFMTRQDLNGKLSGRFGYSLFSKKNISCLLKENFLSVPADMTVDKVSRLAMQRDTDSLYNPVVVLKDEKYFGVVTIKDLLDLCTKIEVNVATHASPLTKLPGNLIIEKEIEQRIFGGDDYAITYYDLDNFKAYNDAYGFDNGDLMLILLSDLLVECAEKGEFVGHIGGDDFIVIANYGHEQCKLFCERVIRKFDEQVKKLYRDEDIQKGYIVSKNRSGVTENFALASLSVAGVTSKGKRYSSADEFSRDIALLKKSSKMQEGSYYCII